MSDLDSFFAKKDKRKAKGKKYTSPEEIAKKLETPERKATEKPAIIKTEINVPTTPELINSSTTVADNTTDVVQQPTEQQSEPSVTAAQPRQPPTVQAEEEEQWNDIVEKTVDVTNLRIARLNLEEEEERAGAGDVGEEGSNNNGEEKKDGVWKVEEQKSLQSTICEAMDAGDEDSQKMKATFAALSANLRLAGQAKEIQPSLAPRGIYQPGMRRKKTAPDINNDMAFPSLKDAQATGSRKKRDETEGPMRPTRVLGGSIRGIGGSSRDGGSTGAYRPPMLRTTNRYDALTDHGSLMRNS